MYRPSKCRTLVFNNLSSIIASVSQFSAPRPGRVMQRACSAFVLLFAMSAPGATRGGSLEPRYKSEFTYDEQLLEKMIRMEAEMDKWETRINEQLGQLTSLREHIDHLIKTEDSRLELIQEVFVESRNNLTALQSRADGEVQQLIEKIKKGEFYLLLKFR
ncbi:uncharacterized protein LOC127848867 [Dreissena polymorpha]|uniref:uncharacterized protein LOC127848867 n=1 Tax=Dreissena polymorpha TaxID=45954 RepID=UPI0022645FE4|nr:uncharacterized protein LOC127848867 [Dreissena polymorpha]